MPSRPHLFTRRDVLLFPLLWPGWSLAWARNARRSLALADVAVIDGKTALQPSRTVVITGDRIAALGAPGAVPIPPDAEVLDARGKYLIPGLWDMHGHLSYTKATALPVLLANGVTGLRDCGGVRQEIDGWRAQVRTGALAGPRIFRCGPALTARSSDYQRGVTTGPEGRQAVRDLARAGVDFVKVHAAIPRDAYFGVMDEARKLDMAVAGHLPRAVSAAEASDAGQRTLEHVDTLFDGRLPSDGTAEQMAATIAKFRVEEAPALFDRFARNGTWFTPTLGVSTFPYLTKLAGLAGGHTSDDRYASPHSRKLTREVLAKYRSELTPVFIGRYERTFDEYLKLVALMHKAGVALLAGSDFATSVIRPGFDLHEELRLLVTAGLPPVEALRTATSNPARCLGQRDLGTIEAGRRADLVLLDRNPLQDVRNTQTIRAVIRDGKLLAREALEDLLASAETILRLFW